MSNEVSPDQMQARIQQARREAENLKDRIKRKKDELADGTRKSIKTTGLKVNEPATIQLTESLACSNCDGILTITLQFLASPGVNRRPYQRTR